MTNTNTVLNPIPMRTWRWLGVNETKLTGEIPFGKIGNYNKKILQDDRAAIAPIAQLPKELAAYAANWMGFVYMELNNIYSKLWQRTTNKSKTEPRKRRKRR